MTATGGSELVQLARATKAIIGLRIYLREIQQPHLVAGPSPMQARLSTHSLYYIASALLHLQLEHYLFPSGMIYNVATNEQ